MVSNYCTEPKNRHYYVFFRSPLSPLPTIGAIQNLGAVEELRLMKAAAKGLMDFYEDNTVSAGGRSASSNQSVPNAPQATQASTSSPFSATRFSSFSEGPFGFFWPCSHFCTVDTLVFR